VSYDGTTPALEQDFSYSTSWGQWTAWTQKTTTVTTKDLLRSGQPSFQTVYTYVPGPNTSSAQPGEGVGGGPVSFNAANAVESSIVYKDWNGAVLQTVTKTWSDANHLQAECTTLDNGSIGGTFYTYSQPGGNKIPMVITDKKEYDYGLVSTACTQPSTTPTRETVTNYQSFADTPLYPTGPSIYDRPSSVQTYDHGTLIAETDYAYDQTSVTAVSPSPLWHDETNYSTSYNNRGNLTTKTVKCLQSGCANAVTTYTYDETGQVLSMTDPCGNGTCTDMPSGTAHTTNYSYADSFVSGDKYTSGVTAPGNTNSYLTQITNPQTNGVSHIEKFSYDYASGQLTVSVDQNGQTTKYRYDDPFARLTESDYPDGGQTLVTYNDSVPSVTTSKKLNTSGQLLTSVNIMDGMGHVTETQLTSDPEGTDFTATTYDGLGRVYQDYNPTRCNPPTSNCGESTWGYNTNTYDALGRATSVVKADGSNSTVTTKYCGISTLVTDEAGHWRRSETDGLGRLIEVDEPNSKTATVGACPAQGDPIWITTYTNDALNDLLSVTQGGSRRRSFTYDSLKRLLTSTNPEAGTVTYGYDTNGNMITKVSPAPNQTGTTTVTTNYAHDALNRLTVKSFSDTTPTVTYGYDNVNPSGCTHPPLTITNGIGRRTSMCDAGGTEAWSYDTMGHQVVEQRSTGGQTKTTNYAYNLVGSLATLTYPSGRTITYTYDSAGRPSDTVDIANSINYVVGSCSNGASSPSSGACYAPTGALSQMQNGTNLVSTYLYNSRLQPCWFYATTGTALPTSTLCTDSATAGNILDLKYNFNLGSGDNGNVIGITNDRDSTRTQSFSYDSLNRITSAQTSSTTGSNCWGETYTIDQWANLTAIGALSGYAGCTQENLSVSVATNNQLSSTAYAYDAAGNMLTDAANTYTYNSEGEIASAASVNYTYDGDGDRLEKSSGKLYWYGAGTEILDESDTSGNFTNEYVFFGGKRIAMRNVSSGTIYYYEDDMLGSSRTMVQAGQTSLCYDGDFYPFGGERIVTNTCAQNYKFEGKERDTETGNDDFGARYYSSRLGRWLSADWSSVPVPVPYANLTNPQTLNLYAMVSDNPETFADLDGHSCVMGISYVTCVGEDTGEGGDYGPVGDEAGLKQQQTNKQLGAMQQAQYQLSQKAQQQNTNQSNPQTRNNQQSTSGINPNYKLPTGDILLKKASDFSAGAGDVLSLGTTYLARKYIFHSDSVVDKKSGAYFAGAATGTAIGAAIGATGGALAEGKTGALFGRGGGFFNRGIVRFGWYWSKTEDAIGLRIGPARTGIHIPFYFP
jgi:RHS repeat-associated protein